MTKILLATHGKMAEGILDAANLIMGKQQDIICLSLKEDDSIDEFSNEFKNHVTKLQNESPDQEVLVLVDLFGASPFNSSLIIYQEFEKVDVVTGLNLPMLLEVLLNRNFMSLSELVILAEKSAKDGVKVLSEVE